MLQINDLGLMMIGLSCLSHLLCSDLCPRVCVPCLEHFISCTFGGLREIPKDLYVDTKKITLIGHTFSSSALNRQNFSRFSKPKYSIEQLSIHHSNIQMIQSQSFFDLSGLDTLDLSDNVRLTIEERAFSNLKLKFLTMDHIGTLLLDSRAFDDLLVASLSIKDSNLEYFPFTLVKPISKDLRKLFLSRNRIQSLSPQFEALFRQLTVLDLHGNPLMCTCDLMWLSTTLRWRLQHSAVQADSFYIVQPPICNGPLYLKGEPISRVDDNDFDCNPPKLSRIEVEFSSFNQAVLRCAASMEARRAPLNISWSYIDSDIIGPRDSILTQTAGLHESSITIDQWNVLGRFICWIFGRSGNASVKVNINWPIKIKNNHPMNITHYRNTFNDNIHSRTLDNHQSFFFREQYSLLELVASVISTFILTMLLFVVVYRLYFYKAIKMKKEQLKKSGYATYEVGLYYDSQTYDIPQYPSHYKERKIFQSVMFR